MPPRAYRPVRLALLLILLAGLAWAGLALKRVWLEHTSAAVVNGQRFAIRSLRWEEPGVLEVELRREVLDFQPGQKPGREGQAVRCDFWDATGLPCPACVVTYRHDQFFFLGKSAAEEPTILVGVPDKAVWMRVVWRAEGGATNKVRVPTRLFRPDDLRRLLP